ncbi:hypothetical protein EGW08_013076 [Elysia chlorotica]|uniref:Transporter n=1 Tax=Elysia chlorotica TaxID=188477 RepID=A0A433TC64_ELYCH|nr:hypothetical protein EGW08_013076 [Elysia chlorotica]
MEERQNWSKKLEFMLATIGYAVGLGNVWRFPYLCFRSGGGAFLIPFFIMLVLCGVPLAFMEMAVGQYTRQGPIGALAKLCPFFKGAGLATVVISFLFTTYYIVIITWAFFYMFHTFSSELPWSDCSHDWNSDLCRDGASTLASSAYTATSGSGNDTSLPLNQNAFPLFPYPSEKVLQKSGGIEEQGSMRWELLLILLMCWTLVYFCIWKGPKSTGKVVVYFTATFPYVVLFILLIRGITLDGSGDGIDFFIRPRWNLLLDAKVWVNAAAQNFNSLGVAFGGLITMSSYSKFNNNIVSSMLQLILNLLTRNSSLVLRFLPLFCVNIYRFNVAGHVNFIIPLLAVLYLIFFPYFVSISKSSMLQLILNVLTRNSNIDCYLHQFASVEVIVTTIQDHFGDVVRRWFKRKEILVLVVCFISFLAGLPNITQGGFYFFQLIDYYAAALSLMVLAFFEVIAICWFYGARNLANNIKLMTGSRPNIFFIVCWYGLSPLLIFGIWVFSMIQYKPLSVAGYVYPPWAVGLGWVIALVSVLCIPAGMIHSVITSPGNSWMKKIRNSFKPNMKLEQSPPILPSKAEVDGVKTDGILLTNIVTSKDYSDQHHRNGAEGKGFL